jgi:hypothetical protein
MALGLLATACPFGDCWGDMSMTIRVADGIDLIDGDGVMFVKVVRIRDGDVTGTTPDGLPSGPKADDAVSQSVTLDEGTRAGTISSMLDPYPSWFYAYIDLNRNLELDAGEPFGAYPENPLHAECEDYTGTIVIDRTFAP